MIDPDEEDFKNLAQFVQNENKPTTFAEAADDLQAIKRILRRLYLIWKRAYPRA